MSGKLVKREAYGLRCLRDSVIVGSLRAAYRDVGIKNRRSRQMRNQSRLIATPTGP